MRPIGEGEAVEFDGLRRRRTVLDPNRPGSLSRGSTIVRSKTLHPPLGMSHFPSDSSDTDSDNETEYHPGFFQRLKSRGKKLPPLPRESPAMSLANLPRTPTDASATTLGSDSDIEKGGYKAAMQEDTEYRPHGLHSVGEDQHIHFAPAVPPKSPRATERESSQSSLKVPRPSVAHTTKRQFSFQNVFGRHRSNSHDSEGGDGHSGSFLGKRPRSRKHSKSGAGTEEERLGLVKGDSRVVVPGVVAGSYARDERGRGQSGDDAGLVRYESPESMGPEFERSRQGESGSGEGMNVRVQDELGREISVRDWERERREERDGQGPGDGSSGRAWRRDMRSADSSKSGGAFL